MIKSPGTVRMQTHEVRESAQSDDRIAAVDAAPLAVGPRSILALQRAAGNAAVTRLLSEGPPRVPARARSISRQATATAPEYKAPAIQKVFEANGKTGSGAQTAALFLLDKPRTGPWTSLSWDEVAKGAAERVYRPSLIDQATLGICGPAAALNASAERNAVDYVLDVIVTFTDGTAAGTKVNKTLLAKAAPAGMAQVDFMLLAAMEDVTNTVFEYHGEAGWREGKTTGDVETLLQKFAGCVKTTTYSCFYWGEMDAAKQTNDLLSKHGKDVVVVIFLNADLLNKKKTDDTDPNHFIRVLSPMSISATDVKLDAFTWGSNRSFAFSIKEFEKLVSAFIVGARKPEIKL